MIAIPFTSSRSTGGLTYEDQQAYIVGLTEDQQAFTIYIHIPPPGPIPIPYGASTYLSLSIYIYTYILAIFYYTYSDISLLNNSRPQNLASI